MLSDDQLVVSASDKRRRMGFKMDSVGLKVWISWPVFPPAHVNVVIFSIRQGHRDVMLNSKVLLLR